MRSPQKPIQSGFDAASTAADVIHGIDLTGKIALVTGGYSGIGVETVRALAHAGAHVIVPTRNETKAAQTLAGISNTRIEPMDLTDPASIDAFASRFVATGQPLHMLINSAGIMATPFERDARGYEIQFATNHLGHFQLTRGLLPALQRAQGARVVSVSSWGHRYSPVVFDDIHFERREYNPWAAYGQSKTANILFAVELDARYQANGIRAFAVHPGLIIDTGLGKHMSREDLKSAGVIDEDGKPILDPSRNLKTVPQGAATSVWCAVSPQLDGLGGVYAENADISPIHQGEVSTSNDARARTSGANGVLPYAIDESSARHLWDASESMLSR
ncbi:oxidoreductase [Pinirhizobacter sp.]|jgi:NAD(P)-dependent dehydrogenase (short-subunit alcohol dehydrogenase family)|uniref:oxidoreductase n=1 Tax=Pinirhizobacter sp. TaxID=2950432 RepID=UPI002F3E6BC8